MVLHSCPCCDIHVCICIHVCVCVCVAGFGHKWEWGSCDASLCEGPGVESGREGGGRRDIVRKGGKKRGKRGRQSGEVEARKKQREVNEREGEKGERERGGKSDRLRERRGERGGLRGDCESCGNVWPRQERRERRE